MCEAGRRKFQIALTFLFFELSESTTPFWDQQGEARRMITDLVGDGIFEVPLVFMGKTIENLGSPENHKTDQIRYHSTRLALLIPKRGRGF